MADEDKDWQLDATLDSLLRSYSAADPRPGYETRLRAVVSAKAARVWRINFLMVAASAAAVVLFAWMMIARTRTTTATPDRVAVRESIPARVPPHPRTAPVTKPTLKPVANNRFAKVRKDKDTDSRIVLMMAEATHEAGNVVFAREKLYLTPATQPEPEATGEEQARAPVVSIQEIGVAPIATSAPIEIKDISSTKSGNEKGSL